MSQEAVERLLGRLLTDDQIRRKAAASLEAVCLEVGCSLNRVEVCSITRADLQRIDRISQHLSRNIKRCVAHDS